MTYKYKYITARGKTTLAVIPQKSIHPIWEAAYPSYTRINGTDMLIMDKNLVEAGIMKSFADTEGLSLHLKSIGIITERDSIK